MVSLKVDHNRKQYRAQKTIPADVRERYGEYYGKCTKVVFARSLKHSESKVRREFLSWLSEIEERIEQLRSSTASAQQSMTTRQLYGLAGVWFDWFLKRHGDEPGESEQRLNDTLSLSRIVEENVSHNEIMAVGSYAPFANQNTKTGEALREHAYNHGEVKEFLRANNVVLS
ncbi:MAG: hypothetical protein AAGB04_00805, partial [Pseudomonadota bacterium]